MYEVVNKIPEYNRDATRYGKSYADRKHMVVQQGPRPKRPLERVEMDDTKLDLFVIDPEQGMPIGRPTFFSAIDVGTKMPIGINVSFNSPGYLSTMQCLIHSIKKKDYVKERYPEIENTWSCYGVPDLLVIDNAKHYYSESLEDAALELNFILDYSPVRAPWYKACIERFFGTLNRQLLHQQPGTTFSNIFDKGDYDSKKNAVISYEALVKIFHVFVIDVYAREEHDYDGFPDVPTRRWDELIKDFPPALPSTAADLKVLIGQIEWRVISPNGIEMFGLFYNCDELAELRSKLKGAKAKIKLDPNDLSIVFVADLANGRYIPVPAKNLEYTKGLTLFQHDVIRRYARKLVSDYVNIESLCRAKQLIKDIVREEWDRTKKSDTRVRMARFLNYGGLSLDGGIESITKEHGEGKDKSPDMESAHEFPRLHSDSTSDKGESDLGSAFPILEMPGESAEQLNNQPVQGSIEMHPAVTRNSKKKSTGRSKHRENNSKRHARGNKSTSPSPPTAQQNTPDCLDETRWGVEYE